MKYIIVSVLVAAMSWTVQAQQPLRTEHVILITFDGLRWQELFTGADSSLIADEDYVTEPEALKGRFWDDDPGMRRLMLMPFFWAVMAEEGQIYGNRAHGSKVDVTNNFWFSYPGYNEILAGFKDDRITSNDKINNPNVTVLEHINNLPEFRNSVAAFGSWDVFPFIINEDRSGIPVNAGFRFAESTELRDDLTDRERFLNRLQQQIPSPWSTVRLDAFTHHYAMEHLKKYTPRLMYISYGETDDFAHDGEYDQYLHSARRTDAFIEDIWNWTQSHAPYRNTTTLIITTDHGRGTQPKDTWRSHGTDIAGSDHIWFAVIGPDTKPLGEIKTDGQYYQNQFARTVAGFLGVDYTADGKAGAAIEAVINR